MGTASLPRPERMSTSVSCSRMRGSRLPVLNCWRSSSIALSYFLPAISSATLPAFADPPPSQLSTISVASGSRVAKPLLHGRVAHQAGLLERHLPALEHD